MINNPLLRLKRVSVHWHKIFRFSHLMHNCHKVVYHTVSGAWNLAVIFLGCKELTVKHDENLAGRRAKEFAEVAFVRQDFESAYHELSDAAKRYVSLDDFKKTITRFHTKGYPQRIELKQFEQVPSERKAIYIFLVGQASSQRYYYRLMLEATPGSDYKVSVVDIEYAPYSGSPLRKNFNES
jgi:UDP:flavonoid glycosyltransferase YjiC (YdhE family)